jgi:hypothetical protein
MPSCVKKSKCINSNPTVLCRDNCVIAHEAPSDKSLYLYTVSIDATQFKIYLHDNKLSPKFELSVYNNTSNTISTIEECVTTIVAKYENISQLPCKLILCDAVTIGKYLYIFVQYNVGHKSNTMYVIHSTISTFQDNKIYLCERFIVSTKINIYNYGIIFKINKICSKNIILSSATYNHDTDKFVILFMYDNKNVFASFLQNYTQVCYSLGSSLDKHTITEYTCGSSYTPCVLSWISGKIYTLVSVKKCTKLCTEIKNISVTIN